MAKVLRITSTSVLGHEINNIGCEERSDCDHSGYKKQFPIFHRRKQLQETRAEMRPADAFGIGGDCQKWEDRRNADDLKEGLRKREQKNQTQLRSAVRSG